MADLFLRFWCFVDEVFYGLVVVLEPVPEIVDLFHEEEVMGYQLSVISYQLCVVCYLLSGVDLSNAMRLHIERSLERTRLPYIFSISDADKLVVI